MCALSRGAIDYLPGAIEEIVRIHDILSDGSLSTDIFTGCYAGEEAFYSTAGNEDIIHMATHGFHYSVLDALKASYLSGIHDYTDPLVRNGLKMAGAKTILMSLWEVDDEATNTMMQNFYTHLYQPGVSTSQAFNLALKDMKNLYPDPDYWAPFVLLDALD